MSVKEQKSAPKVHRLTTKEEKPSSEPAPEETAPVAKAVSLQDVVAEDGVESEIVSDEAELIDNDDDLQPVLEDDDDDDSDLSLLEDASKKTQVRVEDEDSPEEGFLQVYSEDCLQCKSLIPFAKKKFKGCHFSAGNKHCPASETQVVIRVPLEEIVPRFMSAERAGDFSRLSKLNAKLAEKPDWFQHRVAMALKEARNKT